MGVGPPWEDAVLTGVCICSMAARTTSGTRVMFSSTGHVALKRCCLHHLGGLGVTRLDDQGSDTHALDALTFTVQERVGADDMPARRVAFLSAPADGGFEVGSMLKRGRPARVARLSSVGVSGLGVLEHGAYHSFHRARAPA